MKINPESVKYFAKIYRGVMNDARNKFDKKKKEILSKPEGDKAWQQEEDKLRESNTKRVLTNLYLAVESSLDKLKPLIQEYSGHTEAYTRQSIDLIKNELVTSDESVGCKWLLRFCLTEVPADYFTLDPIEKVYREVRKMVVHNKTQKERNEAESRVLMEPINEHNIEVKDISIIDRGLFWKKTKETGEKLLQIYQSSLDHVSCKEFVQEYNAETCILLLRELEASARDLDLSFTAIPIGLTNILDEISKEHRLEEVRREALEIRGTMSV